MRAFHKRSFLLRTVCARHPERDYPSTPRYLYSLNIFSASPNQTKTHPYVHPQSWRSALSSRIPTSELLPPLCAHAHKME
jgi:hypothetical protein